MGKTGLLILAGGFLYAIVAKSSNSLERSIRSISSSIKWKAYYKAAEKVEKGSIPVPESPVLSKDGMPLNGLKERFSSMIENAIDSTFGGVEAAERPLEGQIEASKEENCKITDEN